MTKTSPKDIGASVRARLSRLARERGEDFSSCLRSEKLEAMVQLGMANSRMKDFYDIAVLARDFDFDAELLARAIRATFERRKTPLPTTTPIALTAAFTDDATKKTQWSGFVRKAGVRDAGSLAETILYVRAFVDAPLMAAANGTPAPGTWRAGGAWG